MSEDTSLLMDGEKLKEVLEQSISSCETKLVFISAYITQTAVDWIAKHASSNISIHLICRLQPSDVLSGATHISALTTAIKKGWKVSCLHSLHAKIYSIDDQEIYVGSANLTNNGLKIFGTGNLEACSEVPANQENLRFISNIELSSTELDLDILKKMDSYIQNKTPAIHLGHWPEGTLPEHEGIWVQDFFWFNPMLEKPDGNEKFHDLDLLRINILDPLDENTINKVLVSRCVTWLISKLEEQESREIYFGSLTKLIHDDLKDDPSPYRKDVKSLVQNLLAYCELFLKDKVEISRPNHSQKIKLVLKGGS